jgi:hypothetical protein
LFGIAAFFRGGRRTVKLLVALENTRRGGGVADWLLGGVVLCFACIVSMASHAIAPDERTADKSGGEGASSDGAGGHSPRRSDSRALEKHGASNWG